MAVEQVKEKAGNALKEGAKKLIKVFGWGFILEDIPVIGIIGTITFPKTRLVLRQAEGVKLLNPDVLLMLIIAATLDITMIVIAIIEICVGDADFTIISTIIGWGSTLLFGAWIYMRTGSLTGGGDNNTKTNVPNEKEDTGAKIPERKNPPQSAPPTKKAA